MPIILAITRPAGRLTLAVTSLAMCLAAPPHSFATGPASADERTISIVENWTIHWQEDEPEFVGPDGYSQRFAGQSVTRTVNLPPRPSTPPPPLHSKRIIAKVTVEPVTTTRGSRVVPNDPWNRLGNVVLITGERPDGSAEEIELIRFITGYGGAGVFEQDVTEFAPLLAGVRTFRVFLSSFSEEPGWSISCQLIYTDEHRGAESPAFAAPLMMDMHITAAQPTRRATIEIPEGLDQPRLRILTTGHATDGEGANEFVSSTHVLKIDGRTIARWRPWAEGSGKLREKNPWSGRTVIDGREVWASDLSRSGWRPGCAVEPLYIPAAELTPGRHQIELVILGIRPQDPPVPDAPEGQDSGGGHGYWSFSAAVVADAPLEAPDSDD